MRARHSRCDNKNASVCVWLEQKWSKAKSHEKLNSMVLFDQKTYDKMLKDVPKVATKLNPLFESCSRRLPHTRWHCCCCFVQMKLITPSIVSDRLKVNGSLARKAIAILLERGDVREIAHHNSQSIYTRATAGKA